MLKNMVRNRQRICSEIAKELALKSLKNLLEIEKKRLRIAKNLHQAVPVARETRT